MKASPHGSAFMFRHLHPSIIEPKVNSNGAWPQSGCCPQIRRIHSAALVRQIVGEQVGGPTFGRLKTYPG